MKWPGRSRKGAFRWGRDGNSKRQGEKRRSKKKDPSTVGKKTRGRFSTSKREGGKVSPLQRKGIEKFQPLRKIW